MKPRPVWWVKYKHRKTTHGDQSVMQLRAELFPDERAVKDYMFQAYPDLVAAIVHIERREVT